MARTGLQDRAHPRPVRNGALRNGEVRIPPAGASAPTGVGAVAIPHPAHRYGPVPGGSRLPVRAGLAEQLALPLLDEGPAVPLALAERLPELLGFLTEALRPLLQARGPLLAHPPAHLEELLKRLVKRTLGLFSLAALGAASLGRELARAALQLHHLAARLVGEAVQVVRQPAQAEAEGLPVVLEEQVGRGDAEAFELRHHVPAEGLILEVEILEFEVGYLELEGLLLPAGEAEADDAAAVDDGVGAEGALAVAPVAEQGVVVGDAEAVDVAVALDDDLALVPVVGFVAVPFAVVLRGEGERDEGRQGEGGQVA